MSLKNSALLLALVTSLSCLAQTAQGQSRQRWSFGPRLGLNLTNFVGDGQRFLTPVSPNANPLLPGLSAGVGFLYSDVSRFGMGFDLLYAQRGSTFRYRQNNTDMTTTLRANYVELPIVARYFLTRDGNFRPNLFAGIVPALCLNKGNLFAPADLGVTAGFQLNFRAGDRRRFTVDGRYTQGVTEATSLFGQLRNQQFTLGLGYNFGIGRQYQPGDRKLTVPN